MGHRKEGGQAVEEASCKFPERQILASRQVWLAAIVRWRKFLGLVNDGVVVLTLVFQHADAKRLRLVSEGSDAARS